MTNGSSPSRGGPIHPQHNDIAHIQGSPVYINQMRSQSALPLVHIPRIDMHHHVLLASSLASAPASRRTPHSSCTYTKAISIAPSSVSSDTRFLCWMNTAVLIAWYSSSVQSSPRMQR